MNTLVLGIVQLGVSLLLLFFIPKLHILVEKGAPISVMEFMPSCTIDHSLCNGNFPVKIDILDGI